MFLLVLILLAVLAILALVAGVVIIMGVLIYGAGFAVLGAMGGHRAYVRLSKGSEERQAHYKARTLVNRDKAAMQGSKALKAARRQADKAQRKRMRLAA